MVDDNESPAATGVPVAARVLGAAGLLPPLIAILLYGFGAGLVSGTLPLIAAIAYAAIILSFLGGMWWGMAAMRLGSRAMTPWLVLAVLPSLIAWPALLLALVRPASGAAIIALALVTTLLGDRQLRTEGLAPDWWMRLRVPLSCGLALLTITTGWLAGR